MIHPTAIIDEQSQISSDVIIGPYCIVGPKVCIDSGTVLKSHVVVSGRTTIGKNNKIYPFASIGEDPQDKKYAREDTEVIIGDGNTIREYVTINLGTVDDQCVTRLGNNNWIMAYVHIAHDCVIGDNIIMANCASLAGHVHIGNHVILGGFAKLHQFCRVGDHAFVAMDSGFQKDLPPFIMAQGSPAVPRGINFEGLKRRGFDQDRIAIIKKAYRLLYKSQLPLQQALVEMKALQSDDVNLMVDFITQSDRSIIR